MASSSASLIHSIVPLRRFSGFSREPSDFSSDALTVTLAVPGAARVELVPFCVSSTSSVAVSSAGLCLSEAGELPPSSSSIEAASFLGSALALAGLALALMVRG